MLITAYIVAFVVIAALDAAIVYDFLRYRYKNDNVPAILIIFALTCVVTVVFTTLLLVHGAPGASSAATLTAN